MKPDVGVHAVTRVRSHGAWLVSIALATAIVVCLPVRERVAASASQQTSDAARWFATPQGRVKTKIYRSPTISAHPIVLIVLHGDFTDPPPVVQYDAARGVSGALSDIVGVGLLRPGYADADGDRSAGRLGNISGDNYTAEVVDAVASVAKALRSETMARALIVFGHSGGAVIGANLIGRHPGLADAALLTACNCDVEAWRARMRVRQPSPLWDGANPSLLPLKLVSAVSKKTRVRLVAGSADDNALPEYSATYAAALQKRGVDVQLTVAEGLRHDLMGSDPVRSALREMIASYPSQAASPR